ncbi:MAG: aminomethyl-transferring glycine dehydrogenase [Rhodocyclaceae bacterium]|nr:aminomethyl-transferring glycine dehydrogenase [Rhodocyclaceae bacterium]
MTLAELEGRDEFIARHIGPTEAEQAEMCAAIGVADRAALIAQTIPEGIRLPADLPLPGPQNEHAALARLEAIAAKNQLKKSFIGLGYYGTYTPPVIQRNVLENPGWYTAYTPYQAEIAQGRLEALLNFQQMVIDLTGLELANASLLDEATAAAEAMALARRASKATSQAFFVDQDAFPQTIEVVKTRAGFFGFELIFGPAEEAANHEVFGALLQTPNAKGELKDFTDVIAALKAKQAISAIACDLMALVLTKPPGEMGADIALGSSQRFGIPLGYGGPHAAFFACREEHKRQVPGRIIGVSKDARGRPALRMALQTREQHIRREKANSNICTSQVLLANMAGFYAVWHGPQGLSRIARRIHKLACHLARALGATGAFFDTIVAKVGADATARLKESVFNVRHLDAETIGISLDETTTREDVETLAALLGKKIDWEAEVPEAIPPALRRTSPFLTHPVFNRHHTEHAMLRYLKSLQDKDLALDRAMIPLGSCTMKLTPTAAMMPVSWPAFAKLHPFVPAEQAQGYAELIGELSQWLATITGFDEIYMQPNSGAQGEYAGLVAIRRYQASLGQGHRDVCLIPKSAHGTNPATAQMAGLTVVAVECDALGNVDLADLAAKAKQYAERLSCLMLTYPSTHGVFEAAVREMCALIHEYGGQVYMDGANLNAQVGLTAPGFIGADVSHINLHKTFAIPHGGGGPGMGPIGLKAHLAPHVAPVSAAPYGSASILPISWMYIAMMGGPGLRLASEVAILNANYVAARLQAHYPVLYTGAHGRVAHECILDIRTIKASTGISELDIAKRLMDYGFHAPTVSFPVAGTLMVEPTESENKAELDRFCEAMIAIREEIRNVEQGLWPREDNPLKHAPHTQADLVGEWQRPYSRETAVFPLPWVAARKFWPSVNRIDDAYGDRHLFCACVPMEEIAHG